MREQEGFTLIELLIVIVILGVLAAIVVFAVSGISDRGQAKACATDKKALETAEESYYAQNPTNANPPVYAAEATLQTAGFIHEVSTLHDITVPAGGASYSVTPVSPCT
jgi:general secretion pathway protein G